MSGGYVWRDLTRNPRRSLSTLVGMTLGVGLFSSVLFFVDGSSASMTARAIAPLPLDMQRILSDPLGNQVQLTEKITPTRLQAGETGHVQLTFPTPAPDRRTRSSSATSHPLRCVTPLDRPRFRERGCPIVAATARWPRDRPRSGSTWGRCRPGPPSGSGTTW